MWTLSVLVGERETARHEIPVGKEVVVGRDPGSDIILDERSVSRRHCRLVGTATGVEVVDLHSANGIWVGGKQVPHANLSSGDEMQIGMARVRISRRAGQTGMIPMVNPLDLTSTGRGNDSSVSGDSSVAPKLNPSPTAYRNLDQHRLMLLIEAGKSLSGALEVDDVLQRIMEHLFQILSVKRGVIALLEPDGSLRARVMRPESDMRELSTVCSQHIIQDVIRSQKPAIIDDARQDDHFNRAQSILAMNIRAAICAPLSVQARVIGALYADYPGRARLYSQSDLDFLGAFAGLAAVALENARLQAEAREREKLQRDLEIAGEIQLGLLPDDSFRHPGVDIDWAYRPSKQVGGDFYDCTLVEGGKIALVLGDVSGKSVAAALFMARIMSFLRSLLRDDPTPSKVLTGCNELLGIRTDRAMFATACYILLDPDRRTLRFSSAGHNPALVYDPAADTFIELGASGVPLGILEEVEYGEREVALAPGSLIVLYTDGLVEARNVAGEFFGLPAVKELVRHHAAGASKDISSALLNAVEAHWAGSSYIRDDFALLVTRLLS